MLDHSFTAHMPFPMTASASAFGSGKCYSPPQWCHLRHLCTALI